MRVNEVLSQCCQSDSSDNLAVRASGRNGLNGQSGRIGRKPNCVRLWQRAIGNAKQLGRLQGSLASLGINSVKIASLAFTMPQAPGAEVGPQVRP